MSNHLIKELCLKNLLSFGSDSVHIPLEPLNVLIGPNGSGKSNLLEAISLLRAAPTDLSAPVKEAGGVRDWLWKGIKNPIATIEAIIENPKRSDMHLRHCFSFIEHGMRFEVITERIENQKPYRSSQSTPYFFYKMENGHPILNEMPEDGEKERTLKRETISPEKSILSQVKDPERYPTLAYLTEVYGHIRLYREWSFGRYTLPRQPQKADLSSDYLSETCENLALVLNSLLPSSKEEIIEALNSLYPSIVDLWVNIDGGSVQLNLKEGKFIIPATRLSDGTLRYLCLLAILTHPNPPPLVCIEEPELGLHPDALPTLAKLMVSASKRSQLIVTTHSEILVDALTDTPDSVIVCEKHEGKTQMQRLNSNDLSIWLGKYRLGQLWLKGEIGGTRW